jgi:hypothetical protein
MCIDGKCRHLKIFWPEKGLCGRCLSEFIDWRCSQSCWYFRPELWTVALLTFSLVQLHPPAHFPVWISILYTRIHCVRGGGYGALGFRQVNTCCKVSLQINFFRWRHFALPSMSIIFLRLYDTVQGWLWCPIITQCGFVWGYKEPNDQMI